MRIAILLLSGFGLLGALPGHAASAEKESTYEIEVVVFENRLPELTGDEMLTWDAERHAPPGAPVAWDADRHAPPDAPVTSDAEVQPRGDGRVT